MSSKSPPPPPIVRSTKPGIANRAPPSIVVEGVDDRNEAGSRTDRIDWANLSREDKQEFFVWLDEFFAKYLASLGRPIPASIQRNLEEHQSRPRAEYTNEDSDQQLEEMAEAPSPHNPVAALRRLPPPVAALKSPNEQMQSSSNTSRGPPVCIIRRIS